LSPHADQMELTLTIDFSNQPDLFAGFQASYDNEISPWEFNGQ